MKIAGRQGIKCRQGLGRSVQRALALHRPALVGDGDNGCPGRRAEAGSTNDLPRALARDRRGLVDVDACVRIAVERDIGGATPAGVLNSTSDNRARARIWNIRRCCRTRATRSRIVPSC